MASLYSTSGTSHNKIVKTRGKVVKPILKKLSHSEKNSLDLDRGWEDQPVNNAWGGIYDSAASAGRSARDVSFAFTDAIGPASSSSGGLAGKPRFNHARSTSGTSHISVATTSSGGGPRAGTFVHPFQQTPLTSTPPLSYSNSIASFDNTINNNNGSSTGNGNSGSTNRDYSPTITENEDDDDYYYSPVPHQPHHTNSTHSAPTTQAGMRHTSLASQRTASITDMANVAPPLRVNTSRSLGATASTSRIAHSGSALASSLSRSDLHLHLTIDTPSSIAPPAPPSIASPVSSVTPISPLRTSLEGVGFPRLRSRSELDSGARAEHIREARRKFEERERAKEEKHDREMLRKRERRDHKEAKEIERQAAARKNSGNGSDTIRPAPSRKTTPPIATSSSPVIGVVGAGSGTGSGGAIRGGDGGHGHGHGHVHGHGRGRPSELGEKPVTFMSSKYDSMAGGATPSFVPAVEGPDYFRAPGRTNTAKKKTQGYWTGFILWLRTRLFRLGRK